MDRLRAALNLKEKLRLPHIPLDEMRRLGMLHIAILTIILAGCGPLMGDSNYIPPTCVRPFLQPYVEPLQAEARAQGVPVLDAVTIMEVEGWGGYNSPKGAEGPMQVMQSTADEVCARNKLPSCDMGHIDDNLRVGVLYYKELYYGFGNFPGLHDWHLAALAYNGGTRGIRKTEENRLYEERILQNKELIRSCAQNTGVLPTVPTDITTGFQGASQPIENKPDASEPLEPAVNVLQDPDTGQAAETSINCHPELAKNMSFSEILFRAALDTMECGN